MMNLPFPQLSKLAKRAHIPPARRANPVNVALFSFILLDEAVAIRRAQTLRFGCAACRTAIDLLAMLAGLCLHAGVNALSASYHAGYQSLYQGDFSPVRTIVLATSDLVSLSG